MQIIAVDDERAALSGLARSIGKVAPFGAAITAFDSPLDALAYAGEHPVDVAFLDIQMAQMHGLELARKLQALQPRVNLIFVSETNSEADAKEAFALRASGFLLKPVHKKRIVRELMHLRYPVLGDWVGM